MIRLSDAARHRPITLLLVVLLLAYSGQQASAAERRCGWLQNRTPGNWWLDDRDGTWILTAQGDEAEPAGMEKIAAISDYDYIQTYAGYGYACACLRLERDGPAKRVTEIISIEEQPLAECRRDPSLPSPD